MINKLATNDLPRPAPRSSEPDVLASEIIERLTYRIGKDVKVAKPHDWLTATILVVRDRIIDKWMESTRKAYQDIANDDRDDIITKHDPYPSAILSGAFSGSRVE